MTNQYRDTRPEAENIQIELLRKASPAHRFARALSLSQTAIDLAKRAIRRKRPEMTHTEANLEFIRLNYGDALANAVAQSINERSRQ